MIKHLRLYIKTSRGVFTRLVFVYYPLAADIRFHLMCPALAHRDSLTPQPVFETVVCAITFKALDWHFKLAALLEERPRPLPPAPPVRALLPHRENIAWALRQTSPAGLAARVLLVREQASRQI
jgi:hypothetical protein